MAEGELKSAVELALERLRKKDLEEGREYTPLTDEQKAQIAEVRNLYEAKLAQADVMHKSALIRTFDPAARQELEDGYRRERERLIGERDAKIEKIRDAARP